MEPFSTAKVSNNPSEIDLFNDSRSDVGTRVKEKTQLAFESRVGLEVLKLFIRYQMDFKILLSSVSQLQPYARDRETHEANGVTPIPAPTKSTVS